MPHFDKLHYQFKALNQKPTILFLHGFLGTLSDWRRFEGDFADSFGTLTIDLPGHGGSQNFSRDEFSFSQTADRIVRLLDYLLLEQVNLVGYSMGGRLALSLLTHYADRFASAAIESASPGLKTDEDRQARIRHDRKLADKLRHTQFNRWLANWYAQPIFESLAKRPALLKSAIESKLDQNPESLADALELLSVGYQDNLWPKFSSIELPLLFIAGENDAKYVSIAHETARLCPHARAVIIEQAGHNVHLEQPDAYSRQLKQFLTNLT